MEDSDTDRAARFLANLTYRDLSFQIVYNSRTKGVPTASFGTLFNDRRAKTTDRRGYVDVKFEHRFKSGWDFLSRVYLDTYDYEGAYVYDYSETGSPLIVSNQDWALGKWWGGEAQVSRQIGQRHYVTVGTEIRDNFRQDQGNYDPPPDYLVYLDDRRHSSNSALFVQDEFSLTKKLILNSGVRYDHYSTFGSTANPRFGLIYRPREKTTVKMLYGHAFRAPNAAELYYLGAGNKANPDLRPETIRTTELVVERFLGRNWRVAGSAYYYRLDSLITQQLDPADDLLMLYNLDRVRARGLECEIEGKGFHGMDGRLSYAVQRAHKYPTSEVLSNSPSQMVRLNLEMLIFRSSAWCGIGLSYMGPRQTLAGNRAGGFFLADVTLLHRKLWRNFELSASIYNLFDKRYSDPGSEEHLQDTILQDGRTFRIRLTYRLPFSGQDSSVQTNRKRP